ncbi:MAG: putative lipid II flippase FtsW [Thiohalorhabdus sp.]|uniref:putative lipid II flippase FtsW n=1 Tax=Thiohalorhabdus sp. TaxID=3094134 RepID=UPI00397EF799
MPSAESQWRRLPDPPLLGAVAALLGLGLVMVYSASAPLATEQVGSSFQVVGRQLAYILMGLSVGAGCALTPPETWRRVAPIVLLAGLISLVLVLIPGVGERVAGAARWLDLGVARVQVSEPFKVAFILYLGSYLVRKGEARLATFVHGLLPILVIAGLAAALLLLEPDFGAAALVVGTGLVMGFLGGIRLRHLLAAALSALPFAAWAVFGSDYRYQRVAAFLDPWTDPLDSGFQLRQSLIAFGRGEYGGVGLGDGIQKLFYLPEPHTDFMFAVVGEELGLVGTLTLLALYGVVVRRGFIIAERAGDAYERLVAQGITFLLGFQALAHMGVNLGLLPTKGLTLPLVSYGGSSLVATLAALGILASIDLHRPGRATGRGRAAPRRVAGVAA